MSFSIDNPLDGKMDKIKGTIGNILMFGPDGTVLDSGISAAASSGQAKQPSAVAGDVAVFGSGADQGQTIDSGVAINDAAPPATSVLWTSSKVNSLIPTGGPFLPLAGGTMSGNITVPTGDLITLTDAPAAGTSAANKNYVDGAITAQYPISIANGGTGQTTANAALNALLPSQTGQNGKVLQTDGTNTTWATITITITNMLSSLVNTMTSTVNGVAATASIINTNVLSSAANALTSTVNGVASAAVNIINSISLSSSANALTATVNGVASTAVNIINSNVLSSAANAMTSTVNGVASAAANIVNSISLTSSANTLLATVNGVASATVAIINTNVLSSATNALTSTVNGVASTAVNIINSNVLSSSANLLTSTVNGVASTAVNIINSISLTSSANTLLATVNGIASATVAMINTNVLTSSANLLTSTVNGVASTAVNIVNSISLSSAANALTATVNGVTSAAANIINSNVLTLTGSTLTSTVNGVTSAGVTVQTAVAGAVAGDIATLNGSGQTTDSGKTFGNDGTNATVPTSNQMQSYVTTQLLNTPTLPLVQFATTSNITLFSGLTTIDGYTPSAGDFLLVKNQTSGDNGVWQIQLISWARCYNNSGAWTPITTQTTYAQLNINGGVLNVLNGTVAKNIQYQFNIVNPAAVFGATTVYVTALTKLPVRDVFQGYVDTNIGNNTNNNGTASFPYLTVTQDLVGASYPHITYIAPSGSNYTETLTIGSANSNLSLICCDSSAAGKCQFSTTLTLGSNNTRYREVGITRSTGASTPVVLAANNLGRHTFENCIWITSGTSLMTIDASLTNWVDIYNLDATGSPLATIVIPNFTTSFTFNIYRQTKPFAFSFTGGTGANCTINVFNSAKGIVGIPDGFTGNIIYYDGYNVNQVITSQATLNTILASTNPALNGYYAVSFASPVGMSAGCIFAKFSAGGVTANNTVEQFLTCTAPTIYDYTTKQIFGKNGAGAFNAWISPSTGAYLPLSGGTMSGNITIPTGNLITLTDAPAAGTSAANKTYVDGAITAQYPISIANGGTGQTTANAALNALLPSQTGQNGKVLGTNGTSTSWVASAGATTNTLTSSANVMSSTVNSILATANIINTNVLSSAANALTSTVNGVSSAAANIINSISLTSSANTLLATVNGVASATVAMINTNVLTSSANLLTSTVNGVASTAVNIVNSISLTSSANTLLATVNGIASATVAMINTNVLTSSANLLTSTVNGVASTAVNIVNSISLTSSANTLLATVNGIASATVAMINTNVLTLTGVNLSSTINGVLSNTVSVQPLITSPVANDLVSTSGTGQVQDSGISVTTSSVANNNTTVMTSAAVLAAIATNTPTVVGNPRFTARQCQAASMQFILYKNKLYSAGAAKTNNSAITNYQFNECYFPFTTNAEYITDFAFGSHAGVAISSLGIAYHWGWNVDTQVYAYPAYAIAMPAGMSSNKIVSVYAPSAYNSGSSGSVSFTCVAIADNGQILTFGNNFWGQLGINTQTYAAVQYTTWQKPNGTAGKSFVYASMSGQWGMAWAAIENTGNWFTGGGGQLWTCGNGGGVNEGNPLGNGINSGAQLVPYSVPTMTNVKAVVMAGQYSGSTTRIMTRVLKADGSSWASGSNDQGQLADGTLTPRNSFVRENQNYTDIVAIGAFSTYTSNCSYIVRSGVSGGKLYWAGYNNDNALGAFIPNQTGISSFTSNATEDAYGFQGLLLNGTTPAFKVIFNGLMSGGYNYSAVLDRNGNVWAAGRNVQGNLSTNTGGTNYAKCLLPNKVCTDISPVGYTDTDIGIQFLFVDGSIYASGNNTSGTNCYEMYPTGQSCLIAQQLLGFTQQLAVTINNLQPWLSYTPILSSTGTAPTAGAGTVMIGYYWQDGKTLNLQLFVNQTVAGTAGTGNYLFSIPVGFSINTSITGVFNAAAPFNLPVIGSASAAIGNNTNNLSPGVAVVYSSTQFLLLVQNVNNPLYFAGSNYYSFSNGNLSYSANLSIPIQ